jgi:hypothetical protein
MRIVIIMVAFVFVTSYGFAEEVPSLKESVKRPEASDLEKNSGQESSKDKKTPVWPRPYKPTEEISADSVVPFPADI